MAGEEAEHDEGIIRAGACDAARLQASSALLALLLFLHGAAFAQDLPASGYPACAEHCPARGKRYTSRSGRYHHRPRRHTARATPSGIDSVVTYTAADSVIYDLSARTMYLHGKAAIAYKELGLKASVIDINWNTVAAERPG